MKPTTGLEPVTSSLRVSRPLTPSPPSSARASSVLSASADGLRSDRVLGPIGQTRTRSRRGVVAALWIAARIIADRSARTGWERRPTCPSSVYDCNRSGRAKSSPSPLPIKTRMSASQCSTKRYRHPKAPSTGIEPVAYSLGESRSIQLSYEGGTEN